MPGESGLHGEKRAHGKKGGHKGAQPGPSPCAANDREGVCLCEEDSRGHVRTVRTGKW